MNEETRRLVSDIEREQLAIYLEAQESAAPSWMLPLFGLLAGATIASVDLGIPWVTMLASLLTGAGVGGSMALLQKRAGFSPRIAALPRPLRRRVHGFMAAGIALIAAGYAAVFLLPDSPVRFSIAGGVAFVVVAVAGTWFQRDYRVRAARMAREMGITRG